MKHLTRKFTALVCGVALCASPSALAAKQQDYEQLQRADSDFKYDGYFRSGFGVGVERPGGGRDGGDCTRFQAAGTPATYRLGNECNDYAEIGLHKRVYVGDDGEQFWARTRIAYDTTYDNTWAPLGSNISADGEGDIAVREFFAEGQDVIPFLPGAKVWAGRRFYQRQDVHINDFFFWDISGSGLGIEDVPLGGGMKGHFAVMRTNDSGGVGGEDQRGIQFDLRVSHLNTNPNGQLTGGISYIHPTTEEQGESMPGAEDAYVAQDGWAVTFMHQQNSWFGSGFNKVAVQFGYGALGSPWTVGGLADEERMREPRGDEWRVRRLVELMTWEPAGLPFSAMLSAVYQDWKRHDNEEQQWWSFGVRPQWHVNEHFALVAETSYDRTSFSGYNSVSDTNFGCRDMETDCDSELIKFTVAPTFTAGSNFFGRPQIRLYATHAIVDNASGWAPVEDDSYTTYGVQAEAWW